MSLQSFQDLLHRNIHTVDAAATTIHVKMFEVWLLPNIKATLKATKICSGVFFHLGIKIELF